MNSGLVVFTGAVALESLSERKGTDPEEAAGIAMWHGVYEGEVDGVFQGVDSGTTSEQYLKDFHDSEIETRYCADSNPLCPKALPTIADYQNYTPPNPFDGPSGV